MQLKTDLVSYHNDPALKLKHDTWIKADIAADRLTAGSFGDEAGDGWRGCQWGCYMRSEYPHMVVEEEIGLPVELSVLADSIFEGLSNDISATAAREFVEAFFFGPNPDDATYLVGKNLDFVFLQTCTAAVSTLAGQQNHALPAGWPLQSRFYAFDSSPSVTRSAAGTGAAGGV